MAEGAFCAGSEALILYRLQSVGDGSLLLRPPHVWNVGENCIVLLVLSTAYCTSWYTSKYASSETNHVCEVQNGHGPSPLQYNCGQTMRRALGNDFECAIDWWFSRVRALAL